ncbi:MAG TPA: DinB family protein [Gemmatimonadales bacterium]|nr:DinB family protein [Gemmatimonadales bacterium]
MTFETGEPQTLPELGQALNRVVAEGVSFLAPMSDTVFFAPQGPAWSPAEHVRHLRKSSAPLVTALKLPQLVVRLRFGGRSGPSRTFAQLRELYLGKLAAGGGAGRFAPSQEPFPANPVDRRNEIINGWTAVTVELVNAMNRWSETALDRHQLPHPLLGPLSVREMLAFTVYHSAHHFRRIDERSRAGV